MAKFMERHDTQWVLISHDGDHLATLNKIWDATNWSLFFRNETSSFYQFDSPLECFDWMNSRCGMSASWHPKERAA